MVKTEEQINTFDDNVYIEEVLKDKNNHQLQVFLNIKYGHRVGYVIFENQSLADYIKDSCLNYSQKEQIISVISGIDEEISNCKVHGGITYGPALTSDNRIIVGFDTNHYGDYPDLKTLEHIGVSKEELEYIKQFTISSGYINEDQTRDKIYVLNECKSLSNQIKKILNKHKITLKFINSNKKK